MDQQIVKDLIEYNSSTFSTFPIKLECEPNILKLTSPIIVVGDIHGQFHDMLTIF
jgi:hypothetical protein